MARNLDATFISHASAATNRPIVMLEAVFNGSVVRLWNGYGDLSWDGQTWLGNGWFAGIEGGEETTEVEALDMVVILSGVPSAVRSLVLASQVQGARGALFIGFLDSSGAVAAAYRWWQGKYSHADIEMDGETATVRLYYESRLVDFDRPREGRWTNECQQSLFAGDKGFEYVVAAANWPGNWGGEKQKQKKDNKRKNGGGRGSPKKN